MPFSSRRAQLLRTIGNAFLELADEEERIDVPRPEPRLLAVKEAAARLSVSRSTVYRLMNTGLLPYLRAGDGRRIETQAIDRYIQQLRRTSTPTPVPVVPIEPRRPGRSKGKK